MKLFRSQKLKAAFQAIKFDMDNLDENHAALKDNMNDWVAYLDHENKMLSERLKEMERKLEYLEDTSDNEKLSVLQEI